MIFRLPAVASRPLLILCVTLAYVLSQSWLGYLVHQLRPNIFILQLSFDADSYWAILRGWGDEGLRAYRAHFPYDFMHLVIYALFGRVLATRAGLFSPAEARLARRTAWLLPLAAAFDLLENLLQLRLLAGPFGAPSPAIPLSAICSTVKWALALVFTLRIGRRVVGKCVGTGRASR